MNETVLTVISTVVTAIVLPLIALAGKKLIDYINTKTQNEKLRAALSQANEAVQKAVALTAQTYVDELKKQGAFDATAQIAAFDRAIVAAQASISADAKTIIAANVGNLDNWLTTAVEAAVKASK